MESLWCRFPLPGTKFSNIASPPVVFMGDKETDVNIRKQQPQEMHNSELVSKLMGKTE
jgi:hypothetical protein